MKIFSGSSNPKLTEEVLSLLKLKASKAQITRFKNSEVKVRILENVKNKTTVIIQSTSNPTDQNLMELFLFSDALRRQEADKIIGIIPYFGYARQDIQHLPGECVSANVVIRFLETLKFHKIYTIDLHDEATEGVFSIPFKNLSALPLLAEEIKKYLLQQGYKIDEDSVAVVSPDQGGIERARRFGDYFFQNSPFIPVLVEKKRNLEKIHESKAIAFFGDVAGKTAIIVDDVATSGSTLLNAAELCKKNGAKRVLAAIVHHDFAPEAPEKIQNSEIDLFFTTNTIALHPDQKFPKLREISVAPLIAEELSEIL